MSESDYVIRPKEELSNTLYRVADLLNEKEEVTLEGKQEAAELVIIFVGKLAEASLGNLSHLQTAKDGKIIVRVKQADGFEATYAKLVEADWTPAEKLNHKLESLDEEDKHGTLWRSSRLGHILKPGVSAVKMEREINGFKKLGQHKRFRRFLPGFYGTRTLQGSPYMQMENLLHRLSGPVASVDIKMGRKTWDEDAPQEKQEKEAAKIVEGKCSSLGFRLVGMKAGSHSLTHFEIRDKNDLTVEEFKELGMKPFLAKTEGSEDLDLHSLREVIRQASALQKLMKDGYGGVLRAASLFIAREMKPRGKLVFKVIDLAHYTETDAIDENFIDGIDQLLAPLKELAKKDRE